jgi:hypothetical protein
MQALPAIVPTNNALGPWVVPNRHPTLNGRPGEVRRAGLLLCWY